MQITSVKYRTRVTDSNASVDKKLREDPQTESIEAEIDWWHTQKSVKKEWWKVFNNEDVSIIIIVSAYENFPSARATLSALF